MVLPGGRTISYLHDVRGRRIARCIDGTLDRGWLYKDGINPIAQFNAAGAVEATFVYGTRPHVPDYLVKTDGTVLRYVTDHRESVRLLVNASTGSVMERYEYDEWGTITSSVAPFVNQPFGYAGGLQDPSTGLIRFGARDYDPEIGRWTAKDPIGFGGGSNFYGYANNDPVNFIDVSGTSATGTQGVQQDWKLQAVNWLDRSGVTDFTVGMGDVMSFGLGRLLRGALIENYGDWSPVDTCSRAYSAGEFFGIVVTAVATGGASGAGGRLPRALRAKMRHIRNQLAAGGNRGVSGSFSQAQAVRLGEQFVGPGARTMSNGKGLVSADGLRQFRFPSAKSGVSPHTLRPFSGTGWQVNFESRAAAIGRWASNVHLDVLL